MARRQSDRVSASTSRALLVLAVLLLVGSVSLSATAETRAGCYPTCAVEVEGDDGEIDVTVTRGVSERVPGRGDGTEGEAPGRTGWITIEEYLTPTCAANSLNGADMLCVAAVSSCAADNQVRFWVWHRTTQHVLGPPRTSAIGPWVQERASYCLGPDDAGIPVFGSVVALVQNEFQTLPLPYVETQISPAPRTLVNIATRLSAGSTDAATFSPVLLGIEVTITARPTSWRWTFGDGTAATTSVPATEHVYDKAQRVGASVRVTWTGTFTVGTSAEVFTIRAPAYVQGPVTTFEVTQARTELVAS